MMPLKKSQVPLLGGCDFYTSFLGRSGPVLLKEFSRDQQYQCHQELDKNADFQDPTSDLLNRKGAGTGICILTTPPEDL